LAGYGVSGKTVSAQSFWLSFASGKPAWGGTASGRAALHIAPALDEEREWDWTPEDLRSLGISTASRSVVSSSKAAKNV